VTFERDSAKATWPPRITEVAGEEGLLFIDKAQDKDAGVSH
jgi:hypothetical protein